MTQVVEKHAACFVFFVFLILSLEVQFSFSVLFQTTSKSSVARIQVQVWEFCCIEGFSFVPSINWEKPIAYFQCLSDDVAPFQTQSQKSAEKEEL